MNAIRTFGLAALLASSQAFAAVTYNYVGDDFTAGPGAQGPIDPSFGLRITASVIFDDAVGPDFAGPINTGNPATSDLVLSYTISSGPITLFSGDGVSHPITNLEFIFDNGVITDWALGIQSDDFAEYLLTAPRRDYASNNPTSNVTGNFSFTLGTWTRVAPAPVPLPGAIVLLGSASGVFGALRRRQTA